MHARKLLRLTMIQLSKSSGVTVGTIGRVESGLGTHKLTRVALQKALEEAGAEFRADGTVVLRNDQ